MHGPGTQPRASYPPASVFPRNHRVTDCMTEGRFYAVLLVVPGNPEEQSGTYPLRTRLSVEIDCGDGGKQSGNENHK